MIDDITFATIDQNSNIRLCAKLIRYDHEVITELYLDLSSVNKQVKTSTEPNVSIMGPKLETVDKDQSNKDEAEDEYDPKYYEDNISYIQIHRMKMEAKKNNEPEKEPDTDYISCNIIPDEDETVLPIMTLKTEETSSADILKDISGQHTNQDTIYLIKDKERNYVTLSLGNQAFSDISKHLYECYAEDQTEPSRYVLVLPAIIMDVFSIVMIVITCVITFGLCFAHTSPRTSPDGRNSLMNSLFDAPENLDQPACP